MITGEQNKAARALLGGPLTVSPHGLASATRSFASLRRARGYRMRSGRHGSSLRWKKAGVMFTAGEKLSRRPRGGAVNERLNAEKDG